jgi:hypothetical protein
MQVVRKGSFYSVFTPVHCHDMCSKCSLFFTLETLLLTSYGVDDYERWLEKDAGLNVKNHAKVLYIYIGLYSPLSSCFLVVFLFHLLLR